MKTWNGNECEPLTNYSRLKKPLSELDEVRMEIDRLETFDRDNFYELSDRDLKHLRELRGRCAVLESAEIARLKMENE
jgi:hypothetical protein